MPNEHLVLCGTARLTARDKVWRDTDPLRLQIGEGKDDVHLRVEHITNRTGSRLPDALTDLLELASFVYAADQAVTRGGTRSFDYGGRWRRRFRFEVPVRRPDLWADRDVAAALAEALGFLTDDTYEFGFTPLRNPRPLDGYLFDDLEPGEGSGLEEVVLFSGGLDSLGGAVQEVLQGQRRVVLVSHRPVSTTYSRQRNLVAEITARLTDRRRRPLHVAVGVNKGKRLGRDFNQRSRSFLYGAVAAVVAGCLGLWRVRFYENGVTSLNLPISPQLIGGRSSRTTHPKALKGFERLYGLLFGRGFTVENPFLWKTKAEVLREVRAGGHGRLCARAVSCVHTREMTTEHPHCGKCSQCVDRRISALAAGLDESEDPPDKYASDVLTGPREGNDFTMVERYHGAAVEVAEMEDPASFSSRFPETADAVRHVDLPSGEAVRRIFELHKRHADGVCKVLAAAVARESPDIVRRKYPVNCLLSIACGRSCGEPPAGSDDPPTAVGRDRTGNSGLFLDPETFGLRYDGKWCFLGNTAEFRLLARLSRRPGRYVSIDTLRSDVWQETRTQKNTIQRTVSNLRRKLKAAGITGVTIDGSQKEHYRVALS